MWRCRASNQSSRLTNFFLNSEIKYGWKNCRISTVSIPPLTPPPKLTSSVAFTPTLSHTRYRSTNFNINSRKSIQCGITLSTWSNLSNVGPRFTNTRLYTTRQYSTGNDKNSNNTGHSRINFKYSWDFKAFFSKFRRIFSFFKKGKPLTADHIFAIFSWAVFGTTFWVVVGTTTLLSSVLWIVNTLRFQEWVALRVGAYLTKQSGVHISFESAVGNWKQGTIRVQNVILAREGLSEVGQSAIYLTIDRMDVKISLLWMLEGKGILRACKASGVRGFVDRRPEAIFYSNNPNYTPPNKRTLRRGDLEMENLSVSDLLIQLYLPDPTSSRPHPVSIYTLECDQFRNHWLFLDLLSAKSVVGKFDGCLFTFGIPQKEDITHTAGKLLSLERELKINGVPMSLLSKTATGPLNWIKEGTLDISLSITLPSKESNASYKEMVVARQTQAQVQTQDVATTQEMGNLSDVNREAEEDSLRLEDTKESDMDTGMGMEMRFDVMFNHLRVSAPLYTPELSYLNNAVVHPILAYMNSHSKHIPLSFDVRLDMAGLDGARTPAEAGLWLALSSSVALEFSRLVHDTQTTETLRSVANTLLKDCWGYLTGWLYTPS